MQTIETLKKGTLFMLSNTAKPSDKTVYSADGYCRENKKYCGTQQADFCKQIYKKKGTIVYTNFEY
jgi:hypothetical protein